MFSNPLIAQDLVSIIQAERRSDAARFRRLAQFLSGPDDADEQGALRLVSSPRPDSADLAGWLEQSGRALAEIPPNQLQDAARRSLYALVVELLEAVRDHGVEIAVTVDPEWRRVGLATSLLERLEPAAIARGITRFEALYLPQNRVIADIFDDLGYSPQTIEEGIARVEKKLV